MCVSHTGNRAVLRWLNRSRCRLWNWLLWVQLTMCLMEVQMPHGKPHFWDNIFRPMVTYLLRVNVPLQTSAFAAARVDKTAMRPFPRLLWTLIMSHVLVHCACWLQRRTGQVRACHQISYTRCARKSLSKAMRQLFTCSIAMSFSLQLLAVTASDAAAASVAVSLSDSGLTSVLHSADACKQ